MQMNGSGCAPIKLYLWVLEFEFHIFFMPHEISFLFWYCFQIFINVKSTLSLQAILKQVAGQLWPEGCGIPFI